MNQKQKEFLKIYIPGISYHMNILICLDNYVILFIKNSYLIIKHVGKDTEKGKLLFTVGWSANW